MSVRESDHGRPLGTTDKSKATVMTPIQQKEFARFTPAMLLIIRRLGIGEATIYLHQWRSANLLMRRGFITVKTDGGGFGYATLTDSGKETLAMLLTAPAGSRG